VEKKDGEGGGASEVFKVFVVGVESITGIFYLKRRTTTRPNRFREGKQRESRKIRKRHWEQPRKKDVDIRRETHAMGSYE
jgi:hypothetical protein